MADNKQRKPISQTWWGKHQPFKFIFVSLPSISDIQRRWALFQIILSLVFFSVAIAVGLLTIDISKVSGTVMIIAIIFFALGVFGLAYALWIGLHWYSLRYTINNDTEAKRAERDDRLHEDIQALIQEMRQDRNERKNNSK